MAIPMVRVGVVVSEWRMIAVASAVCSLRWWAAIRVRCASTRMEFCTEMYSVCASTKHLITAVCRFWRTVVWELEMQVGWKVTEGREDGVLLSIVVNVETALSSQAVLQVTDWRMLVVPCVVGVCGCLCTVGWVFVVFAVSCSESSSVRHWLSCWRFLMWVMLSSSSIYCEVNSQEREKRFYFLA